ncbi:tyrosine-protein kinase receptor torso [Bombyx mori]|uniref:Tyrosine-protein kinase receptor torso n=1 Tax=Bombyx mori TaxID=7091 RepID=TORSO_BOMMO|nr:tyrosine-protein kinase receptor torso precursor [Bombyx mori]D2IYS2.1 RecName: Full=Tyrosine-protein kinase receptor torso; Flags: Precursor [Bombyx mori]ACZ81657.1 Torso [Bombyx mori]
MYSEGKLLKVFLIFAGFIIFSLCGEVVSQRYPPAPGLLKYLEQDVCYSLYYYLNWTSLADCKTNFEETGISDVPSTVKVRCQSKNSIRFETEPSEHWQLFILMEHDNFDPIPFTLIEPNNVFGELITTANKEYQIWSTYLDEYGTLQDWMEGPIVLKFDQRNQQPDDIKYNVTQEFKYIILGNDSYTINGKFVWNTTGDRDLCFDIANICQNTNMKHAKIWPTAHPSFDVENLVLNDECEIHVKGIHGTTKHKYKTPSCFELPECFLNNMEPEIPQDVAIAADQDLRGWWNINVAWAKPHFQPEIYNVTVRANMIRSIILPGNATETTFRNIPNTFLSAGKIYNVSVYAIIGQKASHTSRRAFTPGMLRWVWAGATAGAGCAAGGLLAATLLCCGHRRATSRVSQEDPDEKTPKEDDVEIIGIESGSADDHWEVRSDRVLLHEVIGEGAFGVVRRGTLAPGGKSVAVKMLKEFPSQEEVRSFRSEMELMKSVGAHPHVVSLVGCCSGRKPLIVAEYCSRGDLLSYLRSSWDIIVSKHTAKYYNNNMDSMDTSKLKVHKEHTKLVVNKLYELQGPCETELTPLDLLSFCRQIAMGMEFLASNRIVHRDLAARNVLVTEDKTLKIADFGLSRDIYEENQYKQKGNGKMPVKWMALESLTRRVYTTQSDVWSFGVVIWEIVTVGGSPYPEVPAARLVRSLRSGYRMPKPVNCSKPLYDIMRACWNASPRDRPTFPELHQKLDDLLHSACANEYITLEVDVDEAPSTPKPQRYIKMLIRGKLPWSRESYERPVNPTSNLYSSPPVIQTKTA